MINKLLNRKRNYRTFKRYVPRWCECGYPIPPSGRTILESFRGLGVQIYVKYDKQCKKCNRVNSFYA